MVSFHTITDIKGRKDLLGHMWPDPTPIKVSGNSPIVINGSWIRWIVPILPSPAKEIFFPLLCIFKLWYYITQIMRLAISLGNYSPD